MTQQEYDAELARLEHRRWLAYRAHARAVAALRGAALDKKYLSDLARAEKRIAKIAAETDALIARRPRTLTVEVASDIVRAACRSIPEDPMTADPTYGEDASERRAAACVRATEDALAAAGFPGLEVRTDESEVWVKVGGEHVGVYI